MIQRMSGMPARYGVPVLVAGLSLEVAVLGMYWDVGYHVDHGRDQNLLTLPHLLIVAGLQGIVIAALLHGAMRGPGAGNERRLRVLGLRLSPAGIVMLGPGRYLTERPVPVTGTWKTMLRLAKGSHLMAMPIYLPPSPLAHRPGVPVAARSGPMRSDTFLLQREARGGPAWLTTAAYVVLGLIVAGWLALLAWALAIAEPRGGGWARPAAGSAWRRPAASQ